MPRDPAGGGPSLSLAFPKPGRTMKIVLGVLAGAAVLGAVVSNWLPGSPEALTWFTYDVGSFSRPWTLVTSGLVTSPREPAHVLFALFGLYIFGTDLEKRWGAGRFVRFLIVSVLLGNVVVTGVDLAFMVSGASIFHPGAVFGPGAAVAGLAAAWARERADERVALFLLPPMSGRTLFWVTVGFFCGVSILFSQQTPHGAFAPVGGVLAGVLLTGSAGRPSPLRSFWLRLRLGSLKRQKKALTVEDILESKPRPAKRPLRGGPPLRVLEGGLDDDLKNRKPPKDKRHLN